MKIVELKKLKKPWLFAGLVIALVLISGLAAVAFGFYPIASVNGKWITQREFKTLYNANTSYMDKMKQTYPMATSSDPSANEIEAQVLDRLIEVSLVHEAALKEMGPDMDRLVEAKLAEYGSDDQLYAAAQAIYGFSKDEFTGEVLVPQAERDVLSGRMFIKGEKFEDQVLDLRRNAKVTIMSPSFEWDGLKVKVK